MGRVCQSQPPSPPLYTSYNDIIVSFFSIYLAIALHRDYNVSIDKKTHIERGENKNENQRR